MLLLSFRRMQWVVGQFREYPISSSQLSLRTPSHMLACSDMSYECHTPLWDLPHFFIDGNQRFREPSNWASYETHSQADWKIWLTMRGEEAMGNRSHCRFHVSEHTHCRSYAMGVRIILMDGGDLCDRSSFYSFGTSTSPVDDRAIGQEECPCCS